MSFPSVELVFGFVFWYLTSLQLLQQGAAKAGVSPQPWVAISSSHCIFPLQHPSPRSDYGILFPHEKLRHKRKKKESSVPVWHPWPIPHSSRKLGPGMPQPWQRQRCWSHFASAKQFWSQFWSCPSTSQNKPKPWAIWGLSSTGVPQWRMETKWEIVRGGMREGVCHSLPHNPQIPFHQPPTKQWQLLSEEPTSSSSPQQKAIRGGRRTERGQENEGNAETARSLKVIYCFTATRREDFTHHTGQRFPPQRAVGAPQGHD